MLLPGIHSQQQISGKDVGNKVTSCSTNFMHMETLSIKMSTFWQTEIRRIHLYTPNYYI